MSKFTKRGQRERRGGAIQVTGQVPPQAVVVRDAGDSVSIQVNLNQLEIPERSYHANTGYAERFGNEVRFWFAQFRVASTRLQSAVGITMPLRGVREHMQQISPAFCSRLETMTGATQMPPFPEEPGDSCMSIQYSATFVREMINAELGSAIDFFEMPVASPPSGEIHPVIRITCAPALISAFGGWCRLHAEGQKP